MNGGKSWIDKRRSIIFLTRLIWILYKEITLLRSNGPLQAHSEFIPDYTEGRDHYTYTAFSEQHSIYRIEENKFAHFWTKNERHFDWNEYCRLIERRPRDQLLNVKPIQWPNRSPTTFKKQES